MHSCISCLCIVVAVLFANMSSIGVTCVVLCTTDSFLSGVISALWLRVSRSPMVHACRDPRLPIPLFYALVGPLPYSRTSQ